MNEIENQLSLVIKKAIAVAEKTGEFAIEQAPLLLQEFYMWHIAKATMGILLGVVLLVVGRNIIKLWSVKYDTSMKKSWDEFVIFGRIGDTGLMTIPLIIFGLFGIGITLTNIYELVFITVAPKLYLIEYFL